MATVLEKLLRVGEGRTLKKLERLAKVVAGLEESFVDLTDEELRGETAALRERLAQGETLDDLMPEAFAAVREAARRTIGLHPFPVQVMGGANLHMGNISEMKTGEGKTLVATMPAFLNALAGRGVHIITVNDYLATYQSELMGRVFRALGMTTGCIISGQSPAERRKQYEADITYGTNNEFGFDYLRDNMASSAAERVQRDHYFVIIDEVDSILIDEARTPLIISGPAAGEANRWFSEFAKLARKLKAGVDYEVDEKKRTVGVLEPGIEKVEDHLGITNLYESVNTPLISFLNNAIKAKALFTRDKDYVVLDGEVLIVDEHTGRILAGRRYNEGMHQAIEAKEGVKVKAENQMLATVTLQNYFRLYEKISGMTGTAETEASEFMSTYKLGVVPIPTNRPMRRIDQPDLVYKNEEAKFHAVTADIVERHKKGQPVLIGTTSVEKSEYLSRLLAKAGVRHEVLNAKNHAREAAIIAQAGRLGAVTVATNMAGRGTDIMLGGNAEHLTVTDLASRGLSPEENPEEYEAAWDETFAKVKEAVAAEASKVQEAGGLYVLGTERHESRRIDNQLRGRSGRQGDPGESRFYLSLADDLMRLFNSGAAASLMNRSNVPDDLAIESKMVTSAIQSAQSQVEARNAEIRKNVLKYDDVLDRQRKAIYADRQQILDGEDIEQRVDQFRFDALTAIIDTHEPAAGEWDFDALWADLSQVYKPGITIDEVLAEYDGKRGMGREFLEQEIRSDFELAYEKREEQLGTDAMRELERRVVLTTIDRRWRDHLYEMEYLKEGIGLRAMAQRDPLVEYQREGYNLFQSMMGQIKEESLGLLFNLEVQVRQAEGPQDHVHLEGGGIDQQVQTDTSKLSYTAPSEDGGAVVSGSGGKRKQQPTTRGAFGQQVPADGEADDQPMNRAQRRKNK
ncbi:preprotein translocase subunit SecA [Leucobacter sp. UCMA 4100]|uniref:preprotein translocase subunit SecA n=1 Tax=Leucobacter sp. UCMA 4100 TaxID=2810534 RepID=UPI0022EA2143|nr:preprotein translocase subunit SecA [Leucobacter sp. UCMA 4100]MDA3146608.1 preprotein translocase subunit SecA [Leucobacter sp. UCMA 4100]